MSTSVPEALECEQRRAVEVEAENFTIIAGEGRDCIADIVFLHGLQGHPKSTWTFGRLQNGKERGMLSKIFHLKPKTADTSASTACFWPEDLLSTDFNDVRILTYGYDSHVSHFFEGGASQATILALGRSFLNDLEGIRRDDPARPVIFIVHSLGGLVLKEALRRSWRADASETDLKTVYDSTKAIMFLGTPHRGSDYAPWGIIARNIAVAVGFDANDRLLKDLRADSTMLDLLRDEFGKMLKEESFRVYTFTEGKGLKGVQGLTTKVVGDESSALNDGRERRDIINANHMEMCRFSGPKDSGYRKVKNALAQCLALLRTIPSQMPAQMSMFSKEADDALAALNVGETRSRFEAVEEAYEDTYNWVFEKPELKLENWLREGSGLYWIQGKPASGKSTMMKKIYKDRRTEKCLNYGKGVKARAAFFFHDRGSEWQKSLNGLLQAILFQVFKAIPGLLPCWLPNYIKWKASPLKEDQYLTSTGLIAYPSTAVLSETFTAILMQRKLKVNICLFLDALDEYSGSDKEIATFLKGIAQPSTLAQTTLKVIFSSRPSQVFLDEFNTSHVPQFRLQDYTANDISVVIDTKMRANARMLPYMVSPDSSVRILTQKFALEVASRAEGVFLWVRLVLDDLLEEFSAGDSLTRAQKSPLDGLYEDLIRLPKDLEAFYDRMLSRIPLHYRQEAKIMFETVNCARKPLAAREFIQICQVATVPDLRQRTSLQQNGDGIERLIRSRSGNLLELIPNDRLMIYGNKDERDSGIAFRVQFIHQTVKSWMQKTIKQYASLKEEQSEDNGHVYIMKYILTRVIEATECSSSSASVPPYLTSIRSDDPEGYFALFPKESGLAEPCGDLLYHAYNAESSIGRSQSAILSQVTDANILWLYTGFMWVGEMSCPPIESVRSFAVAAKLSLFLNQTLHMSDVNQPLTISFTHLLVWSSTSHPFVMVDSSGAKELMILKMLLDANASLKTRWEEKTPFQFLCTEHLIVAKAEMISCFLDHGQDPEEPFTYRERMSKRKSATRTCFPLHHAASERDESTVKILVEHGANVNSLDSLERTPLDRLYRHLGNQIVDFLTTFPNIGSKARSLPRRLRIISFLLDKGGRGALAPIDNEPIYVDYHFDGDALITKDMVNALKKLGLSADNRLVDMPRIQPSFSTQMLKIIGGLTSYAPFTSHSPDPTETA